MAATQMEAGPDLPSILATTDSACTPGGTGTGKTLSSIARQASIYSLTLDEFQNALGEPAKNFGSMNMDEFLKNIWTVEESQAMAAAMGTIPGEEPPQQTILRQASISIPRTLSRKTVDDVWKDISRGSIDMETEPISSAGAHERQVTLGEMTLEDFLVKAGVVKKDDPGNQSSLPLGMSFEAFFGSSAANKVSDKSATFGVKGAEGEKQKVVPTPSLPGTTISPIQAGQDSRQIDLLNHVSRQSDWLAQSSFKTDLANPYQTHKILRQVDGTSRKGVGNGTIMGPGLTGLGVLGGGGLVGGDLGVGLAGGGMPPVTGPGTLTLKMGSPQSPVFDVVAPSNECMSLLSPLPYGFDGVVRGRKREFEGSLEKVVERRQKRMIKNRESAARSRARKQAYTVELEAEVSHLKDENMRLRRQEEEMSERRRKQLLDMLSSLGPHYTPKEYRLRRTHTGPW